MFSVTEENLANGTCARTLPWNFIKFVIALAFCCHAVILGQVEYHLQQTQRFQNKTTFIEDKQSRNLKIFSLTIRRNLEVQGMSKRFNICVLEKNTLKLLELYCSYAMHVNRL